MAILYGTTGDGTTLPVLVDQFGNLLAKGINGEQGPPGPPGTPGIGQLPPDPYEGAILGWEDGELSWLGGSVPLPAGTYGPYVYNSTGGYLEVPQDVSGLVNGQQLYMSLAEGTRVSVTFETDTIASVTSGSVPSGTEKIILTFPTAKNFDKFEVGDVVQSDWNQSQEWSANGQPLYNTTWADAFDGDLTNYGAYTDNGTNPQSTLTLPTPVSGNIRVYGANGGSVTSPVGSDLIKLSDGSQIDVSLISTNNIQWFDFGNKTNITSITLVANPGGQGPRLVAVELDGKILVDSSVPTSSNPDAVSITAIDADAVPPTITVDGGSWGPDGQTVISKVQSGSGSVSLATNGAIVLRDNNGQWVDNYYVTAPEQRIAARKVASSAIRRKTN